MPDNTLTFQSPWAFWLLLLLPLLAGLRLLMDLRSRSATGRMAAPRLLGGLLVRPAPWRGWLVLSLELLALACFITALARPQYGYTEEESGASGRSLIIALDTSKSMLSDDIKPNRLVRARLAIADLLRKLRGDRVGLLPFAGSAYLYAPITGDTDALIDAVDAMDEEIIPRGGSNLARPIDLAIETFKKSDLSGQQALILISDGDELEGEALAAAKRAKDAHVAIIAIGVGTETGGVIPDDSAPAGYFRDQRGNVVSTRLNRDVLVKMARITGGLYLPLGSSLTTDSRLDAVLNKLDRSAMKAMTNRHSIDRYQWPVCAGLLFFTAAWLVGIMGRYAGARPSRTVASAVAALLALLLWPDLSLAQEAPAPEKPAAAEKAAAPEKKKEKPEPVPGDPWTFLKNGDYENALYNFRQAVAAEEQSGMDNPLGVIVNDVEGAVDGQEASEHDARMAAGMGAAAFRMKEWGLAVDAYGVAVLAKDLAVRREAHYNLANALYQRTKELAESAKKKDVNIKFIDRLIRQLENSLEHYQISLTLWPDGEKVKKNHDTVDDLIDQLRKLREQMKQQGEGGEGEGEEEGEGEGKKGQGEGEGKGKGKGQGEGDGNNQTAKGEGPLNEEAKKARAESNKEREGDIGAKGEEKKDGSGGEKPGDKEEKGSGPDGKEKGKGEGGGEKQDGPPQEPSEGGPRNSETGFTPGEAREMLQRQADEDLNVRQPIEDAVEAQPAKNW